MPGEYIENPRRSPRAPVRCEARVALRDGGFWAGPTSDYGPKGCQLVAPVRLEPGSRLYLELVNERVTGPFQLTGRVAWCRTDPPWRAGIAFDDGSVRTAETFFERLAAAYPGLDVYARAPERFPAGAALAPARPPRVTPELTRDEARVLREVGAGLPALDLRDRLGPGWEQQVNAVFALLGRRYLVLGPADPAAADGWAPILARAA